MCRSLWTEFERVSTLHDQGYWRKSGNMTLYDCGLPSRYRTPGDYQPKAVIGYRLCDVRCRGFFKAIWVRVKISQQGRPSCPYVLMNRYQCSRIDFKISAWVRCDILCQRHFGNPAIHAP